MCSLSWRAAAQGFLTASPLSVSAHCVSRFPPCYDQLSEKNQLDGGRVYLGPGFEDAVHSGGEGQSCAQLWQQAHEAACSHLGESREVTSRVRL